MNIISELTVINNNGQFLVSSVEVADMVDVLHKDLLEKIGNYNKYLIGGEFRSTDFFIETSYQDSLNRKQPSFYLTRKGCDMVANKMTGEKGVLFTATYVTKFVEMEYQNKQLQIQPMSMMEMVAYLAQKGVEQEKLEAARKIKEAEQDQKIHSLKTGLDTLTDNLTIAPDASKVKDLINEYCRWTRIDFAEVYGKVYKILLDQHGHDVYGRVKNERNRIDEEHLAKKGKRYSKSTLNTKVTGIDIMVRMGVLDKFYTILTGLLAHEKANSKFKNTEIME